MLHELPDLRSLAIHAAGAPPLKFAGHSPKGGKTRVPTVVPATMPQKIKHKQGMEHISDEIAKTADVYAAHNNPTPVSTPSPLYTIPHGGTKAEDQIKAMDLLGKGTR